MRIRLFLSAAVLAAAVAAGTLVVASALGRSGHASSVHHGRSIAWAKTHHVRATPDWVARLLRHRHQAPADRRARIAITSTSLNAYSNGFETNTAGWCDQPVAYGACDGSSNGTLDREPNGYSDYALYGPFINSATGGWHARAAGATNQTPGTPCVGSGSGGNASAPCSGPYTDWGAGTGASTFPSGGFTTSLDIYLDTGFAANHPDNSGTNGDGGYRFDWDVAMNDNTGSFLQDYAFNAGTAPSGWAGGSGFVVNASTNAQRGSAFPENTCPSPSTPSPPNVCRAPVTITSSGWYTFAHRFFMDPDGNLAVEMTIKDANGTLVPGADWTIHTTHDISTVGGPFAGYFPNEEILGLPIDNAKLTLSQSYDSSVLSDSPVSYWKLNEASGTTANDTADSNNGTYSGGVTHGVSGPVCGDTATSFNGSTGKVTVPDAANLHTGDVFTLEAWLKPSQLGITNGYAAKSGAWQLLLTGPNKIQLYAPNVGPVATSTAGITDTTTWHHVVVTKNGSSVHIYLDGVDVTGTITNHTLVNSTTAVVLGAGASFFKGAIADVALYNYALSAARVATHHSAASSC